MSKLSFRARALDASKPMPIYMAEELPDLPDYSAINRAVPQMPSGMEKEEECEHHLQRAICAGLIIPTPEVTDIPDKDAHDKMYPANYKQPRQLIHMQPFTMEQDIPDYDMDSEDERWLDAQAKKLDLSPLKFEEMMDRLEKSSGQTVVTLQEAKALLKEDDDLIIAVFDYWLNKRLKLQHPLILAVKTEHRAGTAVNNPYLAFRRRTEKMQTRKNRKNDETSYEKMLKLRRDLSRAVTLLELIKRREKMKREYVHLTVEVFEKRYQARDFAGAVAAEVLALKTSRPAFTPIFHNHYTNQGWSNKANLKDEVIPRKEKRQYKKRKHKSLGHNRVGGGLQSGAIDAIAGMSSDDEAAANASPEPEDVAAEDEGQFSFRRNKLCSYHMPLPTEGNWPWCSTEENGLADKRYRYTLTSLAHPARRCVGFARRRMGRGGRVILDRLGDGGGADDFWKTMDFTVYDSAGRLDVPTNDCGDVVSRSDVVKSEPASPTRTCNSGGDVKTVPSDFSGGGDGRSAQAVREEHEEMLEILQSVRREWLHFRPKTPPPDRTSAPPPPSPPDEDVFLPRANVPFSLELKAADETDLFTDTMFISAPFLLDYDISMEVPVTDTRQSTTTTPNHHRRPKHNSDTLNTLNNVDDRTSDNDADAVIGCSRFSVSDGGGASPPSKRQSFLSSTLTSPKLNNVLTTTTAAAAASAVDVRTRTHNAHASVDPVVGNANGLMPQFGFEGGNRTARNKLQQSYGFSRAVSGQISSTNNSTLSLHTSAHTVTLNNSHSANILEIPLSNDGDSKGVVGRVETAPSSPNAKTKTIVRKNNLVMEVT